MEFNRTEIESLEKIKRLNLINSITGIKPANLIGTKSQEGHENLAIFSSIVHLGSNPALIGCVTRPVGEVPRHTYKNIIDTGVYTVNALPISMVKNGHYTSAKFELNESEFEACGFTPTYIRDFKAPFVMESPIQIGLKLAEEVHLTINDTRLLVGQIELLKIADEVISPEGYLDLDHANIAGISGLNSYYGLQKKADFPYARKSEWAIEDK